MYLSNILIRYVQFSLVDTNQRKINLFNRCNVKKNKIIILFSIFKLCDLYNLHSLYMTIYCQTYIENCGHHGKTQTLGYQIVTKLHMLLSTNLFHKMKPPNNTYL